MSTEEDQPILKDREIQKYLNLWAQRSGTVTDARSFQLGRMSVACSILSQARIFEEFGTSLSLMLNKEQIASALRDLLRSLEIDDDVLDVYDSLVTMKIADQPRYVLAESPYADAYVLPSSLQPTEGPRMPELPEQRRVHIGSWQVSRPFEQSRSIEESEAEIAEEYRPRE
jgi:hypothetical protein